MTGTGNPARRSIEVTVNGRRYRREVEPRTTAADFLRHDLGLTGTHVGCEHGVCGACTILLDGAPVRSCILYAVQLAGHAVDTIEGLAGEGGALHPLQEAFSRHGGLQCGFCTPGFVLTALEFLSRCPDPDEGRIREALSGNICRCTGYQPIVEAVKDAAAVLRQGRGRLSPGATPSGRARR